MLQLNIVTKPYTCILMTDSVRVTSGGSSTQQQLQVNQGHVTASPNHKACLRKDGLMANCSENTKLLDKQTFSIDEVRCLYHF